ncbi:hypothetical protein D1872_335940 [compost metagenome]
MGDGISIVVSEETGQISLAIEWQVVRDINEESLISKLYEELGPNSGQNEKRKPFWKKKGGLK